MASLVERYAELYNDPSSDPEAVRQLEREITFEMMDEYGWRLREGKWYNYREESREKGVRPFGPLFPQDDHKKAPAKKREKK